MWWIALLKLNVNFGIVYVLYVHKQGRTSAKLAQASQARLGESSRVLTLILLEPLAQADCPGFGQHFISLRRVYLA